MKEEPLVPPPITYELVFKIGGEIPFFDPLNIDPHRLGDPDHQHNLKLKLKDIPGQLA